MTMANYRIRGPGLSYEQEFQHHGVLGQRWGVITRNVGVNYVPIGQRTGSSGSKPGILSKGLNSFAAGVKKIKADHDAKQANKPLNVNRLSKQKIAKLTNEELQQAIARAKAEDDLYRRLHPNTGNQTISGRDAVAQEFIKIAKDIGKDAFTRIGKSAINDAIYKAVLKDQKTTPDQKIIMLQNLGFNRIDAALEAAANELKANALYDRGTTQFNKLAYKYDPSDPKQAAKLLSEAKARGLDRYASDFLLSNAEIGKKAIALANANDFAKSVWNNSSLSNRQKAQLIKEAYSAAKGGGGGGKGKGKGGGGNDSSSDLNSFYQDLVKNRYFYGLEKDPPQVNSPYQFRSSWF